MAVYKVIIHKRFGNQAISAETWSNTYYSDQASIVALESSIDDIIAAEMAVSKDAVVAFKYAYNLNGGVGGWTTKAVSVDGQIIPVDPDGMLPMWNVARVDLIDSNKRPGIKYLRLPLYVEDTAGTQLTNGVITDLTLNYGNAIMAIAGLCGDEGDLLTGFDVKSAIQMRQTSWSRRFRPGFKRGWVAV